MATTSTSLTVTIVTAVPDPGDESLLLEAEVNKDDNDGVTTYLVGTSYILRLFKSTNIASIVYNNNIVTVSKAQSGLTATVPYPDDDDEYIIFQGSQTASLSKVLHSNFSATLIGSVYDKEGSPTSTSLSTTPGSKTVTADKEVYAVYKVTYVTKYDTYRFQSGVVGPMLIFFIGTSS